MLNLSKGDYDSSKNASLLQVAAKDDMNSRLKKFAVGDSKETLY